MPLQAAPIARPAPASRAANEVVLTPKMSRMASTRISVSVTEMMDLRYWISVASSFLPFSSAAAIRRTASPISQRPTIQAAMAPRIFSPKSAPWVDRKFQITSMFIINPFKACDAIDAVFPRRPTRS